MHDDYLTKQLRHPQPSVHEVVYSDSAFLDTLKNPTESPIIQPKKTTIIDSIKKWMIYQTAVAKAAWSIVVVLGGLLGYQVTAIPIEKGHTVSATIDNRLKSIEDSVKSDQYIPDDIKKAILNTNADLVQFKTDINTNFNEQLEDLSQTINDIKEQISDLDKQDEPNIPDVPDIPDEPDESPEPPIENNKSSYIIKIPILPDE